jgi:hypothetical protein
LGIKKKTAMDILLHLFWWTYVLSFSYITRSRIVGLLWGGICLALENTDEEFSGVV